ncbi:MAG: hypothetical protein Q8L06_15205, partial [Pseudohongiella sp.]|nr:hypothetical protein [Pseudohongiella sp.]
MANSRRHFLHQSMAVVASLLGQGIPRIGLAQTAGSRQRISDIIREYSQQGNHRAGSDIDLLNAHWMRDRMAAMGIAASLEPFSVDKIEVETARFIAPGFETEGEPLYDCHYSGAAGVTGVI